MNQPMVKNQKTYLPVNKRFMEKAVKIANSTLKIGNFPVGCVIEYNDKIIVNSERTNTIGENINEINHAEINALSKLYLQNKTYYDRSRMTLYCTLEPCLMCFGAIILSGISQIVFAYEDVMGGATNCNLSKLPLLYSSSNINIVPGVLRSKSVALFKSFFKKSKNKYLAKSELSVYTIKQ